MIHSSWLKGERQKERSTVDTIISMCTGLRNEAEINAMKLAGSLHAMTISGVIAPFIFNVGFRWDHFSAWHNGRLEPRGILPCTK
jgi:hypothetical protein